MAHGRITAGTAACAAALAGVLAASGPAWSAPEVLSDPGQILKRFPDDVAVTEQGVRVRLKGGGWLEVIDNPFGKAPPVLCWYAPALHVAGVCQTGQGQAVTTLIQLDTGQRVSAPGLASLVDDGKFIAIGPDPARDAESDSLTLVQVSPGELVDEGGALFDADFGPGAWVDGDCYRLTARGNRGVAWLERTNAGWRQAPAAQSTVCQGRHGR